MPIGKYRTVLWGFAFVCSDVFALDTIKTANASASPWTMDKAVGFWKPGEAKPSPDDVVDGTGDHGGNAEVNGSITCLARTKDHRRQESRGEPMDGSKKRDSYHTGRQISAGGHGTRGKKEKGKGKELRRHKSLEETNSLGQKGKMGLCGGPSQELLAMKFMQRKAKVEEARQERDRKANLDRDFSNPYAKRLKTDTTKDRLVCRPDEQDPALVVLGRRSFGGFNVMAEAAYDACIKEIGSGARFTLEDDESDSGVSDTEMADRLGKSVRRGER